MKRGKIIIIDIVILCFIIGSIDLTDVIARKKTKYLWKFGTVMPDAAFLSEYMKNDLIACFEKATNGELTMDIYWGGIMGDEEDYITKMRIDQLQGCSLSVGGVLMACPEMGVVQLPFLFNNYNEVEYIRRKLYSRFVEIYKNSGLKMLIWIDQDFDQIYSTKYEMRKPEDFKRSRFLTHAGTIEIELIKALGGSPIPVGVPEVVPSFRAGVCNSVISPALWWMGSQLYTMTKYVNPYPFRYSPATLVVSNKAWSRLPDKYRVAIDRELPRLEKFMNNMAHKMNRDCLRAMINYGLIEVKMTPEEIDVFRERTKPMWDNLAGKLYPKKLLEEIKYHLRIYRDKHTKKG
ncbi:MAG: TRAP transporter substrate-binding protein DctP [Spirochaetota bacterium]|nr:TRAP transporter substrate-binding protein DctP [Spirochaetota bacterium]